MRGNSRRTLELLQRHALFSSLAQDADESMMRHQAVLGRITPRSTFPNPCGHLSKPVQGPDVSLKALRIYFRGQQLVNPERDGVAYDGKERDAFGLAEIRVEPETKAKALDGARICVRAKVLFDAARSWAL